MDIDKYRAGIKNLEKEFAEIILNAPVLQAQDLLGAIAYRVFNTGTATDGSAIGKYVGADSKSKGRYKARRNARGLRIDTVDLQFSGATLESIKTGKDESGALIGFTLSDLAKIARYNEERYKKPIFQPSQEEAGTAKELMLDYIKDELRNKIKTAFGG